MAMKWSAEKKEKERIKRKIEKNGEQLYDKRKVVSLKKMGGNKDDFLAVNID